MTTQPAPVAARRVSYLFWHVRDVDLVRDFYRDLLGFEVVYAEDGACAFLRLPAAPVPQLAFYPAATSDPADRTEARHCLLAIDVDDLDAAVTALRGAGVQVAGIHDVPHGRAATFHDPDGNALELHQPLVG